MPAPANPTRDPEGGTAPPRVAGQRRVLYADDIVPAAAWGAGAPRAVQVVRALASCCERVTLCAMMPADPAPARADAIVAVSASERARIAEVTGRRARLLGYGAELAPTPAPFAAGVCEEAHATYDSRRGPCAPFRR